MTRIRHKHDAALLDPATGVFREFGNLRSPRYTLQGTTVVLADGRVLIAGGADRAEVFNPATRRFASNVTTRPSAAGSRPRRRWSVRCACRLPIVATAVPITPTVAQVPPSTDTSGNTAR